MAHCFLAWESDDDPLKFRLENPDDPMDEWSYQRTWAHVESLQILYDVLTEKWGLVKEAFSRHSQNDASSRLPGDTVYDAYTTMLTEVSDIELEKIFQPYYKDLSNYFSRLVSLKRRELGRASKGQKGLTRAETKELREKWQHYVSDSGNFFPKLQGVWMTLALHGDDWLATKFKDYCELMDEIYQLEQAATHKPELKHHRPSEIWERGQKRQNKRGKYKQDSEEEDKSS